MSTATYIVGDVFEALATIPDASVDLVLTSPPFLALRSYLPADHPDKAKEIGSEATPAEFLDTLLALTAEWRRVLAPHGSICIELGDTYSGSGGAGGDYGEGGLRDGQARFDGSASKAYGAGAAPRPSRSRDRHPERRQAPAGPGWPLAKSLTGIPTLYAWSLAYGRNLLTGKESPAGQWRIRNLIAWCRPNPPVGALGDKFRPGTSYLTVACVSDKRYFDLDAVRTKHDRAAHTDNRGAHRRDGIGGRPDQVMNPVDENGYRIQENQAGAPPLDWWEIPTQPYTGAHYATWPTALLVRPIKAMCPERVCRTCGAPSRRIVETEQEDTGRTSNGRKPRDRSESFAGTTYETRTTSQTTTLGWTECGHDDWRPGHVLDPFGGSGTTGEVATGHGRDCTLIDLDSRNVDLARQRIGMFLGEVTYLGAAERAS